MKKVILLVLIISIVAPGVAEAREVVEVTGQGKVRLRENMTVFQAQQQALKLAKKNAINKVGTFITSKQVVDKHQLVTDKITVVSAGVIKLKEGTKRVTTHHKEGKAIIKVEAVFKVDKTKFKRKLQRRGYYEEDKMFVGFDIADLTVVSHNQKYQTEGKLVRFDGKLSESQNPYSIVSLDYVGLGEIGKGLGIEYGGGYEFPVISQRLNTYFDQVKLFTEGTLVATQVSQHLPEYNINAKSYGGGFSLRLGISCIVRNLKFAGRLMFIDWTYKDWESKEEKIPAKYVPYSEVEIKSPIVSFAIYFD